MKRIITIDGPASSGKTTVAKLLAERLNCVVLESGAFYRVVTYFLIKNGKTLKEVDFKEVFEELKRVLRVRLHLKGTDLYLEGKKLDLELRSKEVENLVSEVAAIKEVRDWITQLIRDLVKDYDCVIAEGRDMGSVVFPEARLKVFLTADEKIRAKRRAVQFFSEKSVEEVEKVIKKRDSIDSQRKVAPLVIPDGALVIDTSNMTPEEVVEKILSTLQ